LSLKASLKKRRSPSHNEMYVALDTLISKAVYVRTIPADEKHKEQLKGQHIYTVTTRIGTDLYSVEIRLDIPLFGPDITHYKDHTVAEIKIAPTKGAISKEPLSHTLTEVSNMQAHSSIDSGSKPTGGRKTPVELITSNNNDTTGEKNLQGGFAKKKTKLARKNCKKHSPTPLHIFSKCAKVSGDTGR
jgi:hypothetical protein